MIAPYLANQLLNRVFRESGPVYLALHAREPGSVGDGELTGRGYGRQVAEFGEASLGQIRSRKTVDFPDLPGGSIRHLGFWDAKNGGHFLWGVALDAERTIQNDGDWFRVPADAIEIAIGGA